MSEITFISDKYPKLADWLNRAVSRNRKDNTGYQMDNPQSLIREFYRKDTLGNELRKNLLEMNSKQQYGDEIGKFLSSANIGDIIQSGAIQNAISYLKSVEASLGLEMYHAHEKIIPNDFKKCYGALATLLSQVDQLLTDRLNAISSNHISRPGLR